SSYLGAGEIMLSFLNRNGGQANIYIDDVNLYTKTINPYLKAKGFLISPNPTTGIFSIQFYPQPDDLKMISIFSSTGQKIYQVNASGRASNYYSLNVSKYPAGIYIVKVLFANRTIT